MDGCKNVSISHTLPGGRYASVADSQCGQLGEFHTNLVNWTQLTVEKINSYFITVVYKKSSIKCMSTTLLVVYPWPAPLSRYQVTHLTVHVLLIAAAHVTLGQCSVL